MDKNCSFVPKNVHLVPKKKLEFCTQKICTFYTKNEVFAKQKFTKMYKFWIKTGVWYPKMYIWFRKMEIFCTFYTNNEVFAKKFHLNVQILDKNFSFVPKNVHLVRKNLYFLH